MKIQQISEKVEGEILIHTNAEIDAYYVGDFLSRVMGRAPGNSCWFTIMNNVNVAGVATLAEIRIIVLCEGEKPNSQLLEKCEAEGIGLITTKLDCFTAIKQL